MRGGCCGNWRAKATERPCTVYEAGLGNGTIGPGVREKIVQVLSQQVCRGFGPTLPGPYSADQERLERSFGMARDRLVKGLRVAGAGMLEQANRHLETEFLGLVEPASDGVAANPTDAHRPSGKGHDPEAILQPPAIPVWAAAGIDRTFTPRSAGLKSQHKGAARKRGVQSLTVFMRSL